MGDERTYTRAEIEYAFRAWAYEVNGPDPEGEIGPEPYPEALEIDRIVLRSGFGMPEQSLDLPEGVSPEFSGQWLGTGLFYPLDQRGLEWPIAGDLDGDGDLDLVVSYLLHDRDGSTWQGWITAFNDGRGRFASGEGQVLERAEKYSSIVHLDGADLDGDGLLDLVVGKKHHTLIFLNEGQGIFWETAVWQDEVFMGVGDVDGDGDADVATSLYRPENHDLPAQERRLRATLHLNDGRGTFTRKDGQEEKSWSPYALDDFDGDGRAEWVEWWSNDENLDMRLRVCSGFSGDGWRDCVEIPFQQLPMVRRYYLWAGASYMGDLDGDGQWDLGRPMGLYVGVENTQELGMEIRRAEEAVEGKPWLPRKVHLRHEMLHQPRIIPQLQDLNGDVLRDPIFTDMNYRRGPGLLVMRGRKGAWPVEEGRYWLPPSPRGWTCGDVDGDGDTDVVVVVEGVRRKGIFVLSNIREGAEDSTSRYPLLTRK